MHNRSIKVTLLDQYDIQYDLTIVPDRQSDRSGVIEISGQSEVPVIVVTSDDKQHVFLEETHPELALLLNISPNPMEI